MAQNGRIAGLFTGQTAWFSCTVRNRRKKLWVRAGGEITPIDKAQFLFSEDADSEDTKSVYQSRAYLEEHVSVFHPMYIDRCVEVGHVDQIVLGDYFLPPSNIQKLVNKQMHYKWETDKSDIESDEGTTAEQRQADDLQPVPGTSKDPDLQGTVDVKMLKKFQGPLTEFLPGRKGFEVFSVG